jgi:hypothetical protein
MITKTILRQQNFFFANFVLAQNFAGQSCSGNVEQIVSQQRLIFAIVNGARFQRCNRSLRRNSQSGNHQLRMQIALNQSLAFSEKKKNENKTKFRKHIFFRNFSTNLINSPAMTQTLVVPSPTALSCVFEMFTNTFFKKKKKKKKKKTLLLPNLCSRIVQMNGFQNCGAIIRHLNFVQIALRLQNLKRKNEKKTKKKKNLLSKPCPFPWVRASF